MQSWRHIPLYFLLIGAGVLAGLAVGCRPETPAPVGDRITAVTAIDPIGAMLKQLGDDRLTVTVLVPPGQAAETWQVLPRQMEAISSARYYFYLGLPFEEKLVDQLPELCPKVKVVDLREGVPLLSAAEHDHDHAHDHASEKGNEAHGSQDPHIWLDPLRMKILVERMKTALAEADAPHREAYQGAAKALGEKLETLHQRLAALLEPVRGRTFYVFHPAFGYLADRYQLHQEAVEVAGKSPGARQVNELTDAMKTARVRCLFAQPQFSRAEVEALAETIGAKVVLLDDLAPDYFANLESIAQAIAEGLL